MVCSWNRRLTLHGYLPQAVRGNTFTNCLTTQEAFCWTHRAASTTIRFTGVTTTAGSEEGVCSSGGGAVKGIHQGRVVISPQAGNPALTLSPASLIKCGVCWTGPETARLCSAEGGHKHCYTHSSHLDRSTCGCKGRANAAWLSYRCVTVWALAWRPAWEKTVALRLGVMGCWCESSLTPPLLSHTFHLSLQCHVASVPLSSLCNLLPAHAAHVCGHTRVHM